jgi:hypothetical protein
MHTKVCFRHARINEDGNWYQSHDINVYMLYVKRPVLMANCDTCEKEINLRKTIEALRRQDE